MKRGLFITFEGPEGAGKTTQLELAKKWFDRQNIPTILTREPGGTPLAEQFRDIVKHYIGAEPLTAASELLLFEASRAQHVANRIRPAIEDGVTVICDRFIDSTLAYQGYARGMDFTLIRDLNQFASGGLLPDLTIFLNITPEAGLQRTLSRNAPGADTDRMEKENMMFHQRVYEGYHAIAAADPKRVKIIDADAIQSVIHFDICKQFTPLIENHFGVKVK